MDHSPAIGKPVYPIPAPQAASPSLPTGHASLAEITALLAAAAAYQRAANPAPMVLHPDGAAPSTTAHAAAAGHPGIDVNVPAPAAPTPLAAPSGRALRRLFTRAEAAYLMGLTGITAGAGAIVADALGPWAFTIPAASAAACLIAAAAVNRDEQRAMTEITAEHHAFETALKDGAAPRLPLTPRRRGRTAPKLTSSWRAER